MLPAVVPESGFVYFYVHWDRRCLNLYVDIYVHDKGLFVKDAFLFKNKDINLEEFGQAKNRSFLSTSIKLSQQMHRPTV